MMQFLIVSVVHVSELKYLRMSTQLHYRLLLVKYRFSLVMSTVTIATSGIITVRFNKEDDDSKLEYYAISGGVIEIIALKVLVDEADHSDDIIEVKARQLLSVL